MSTVKGKMTDYGKYIVAACNQLEMDYKELSVLTDIGESTLRRWAENNSRPNKILWRHFMYIAKQNGFNPKLVNGE